MSLSRPLSLTRVALLTPLAVALLGLSGGARAQSLQALQAGDANPAAWGAQAGAILREHRELVRIERRDAALRLLNHVDTPYRAPVFDRLGRDAGPGELAHACATARRLNAAAFASSYFVPSMDGLGVEVMDTPTGTRWRVRD